MIFDPHKQIETKPICKKQKYSLTISFSLSHIGHWNNNNKKTTKLCQNRNLFWFSMTEFRGFEN